MTAFIKYLIVGFVFILVNACASRQQQAVTKAAFKEDVEFPGAEADSLVAYIERTRCFGICPVYSISVYRSGFVLYEGIDHTKPIGKYFTWMNRSALVGIGEKAQALGFFELNNEYKNPYLTDFPTVYVEVRYQGKIKRITHYDAEPPRNLVEMEDYLDGLFKDRSGWVLHPDQNYKD